MIYRMRELALIIMRLEMLMIVGGTYQEELTHTPPPCNDPHMNVDMPNPRLEDTSSTQSIQSTNILISNHAIIYLQGIG